MGENEIELLRHLATTIRGGNGRNAHPLNDPNVRGEASPKGTRHRDEPGEVARRSDLVPRDPRERSSARHPGSTPSRSAMSHFALSRLEQELFAPTAAPPEAAPSTVQNELRAALGMLRRRWRLIAIGAAAGLVIMGAYAFTAPVQFKGTTQIAVDPKRLSVLETPDDRRRREEPTFDPARVDSQVEAAKSDSIGRRVVRKLNLVNDPEFNGSDPSFSAALKSRIFGLFGDAAEASPERLETVTVHAALSQLKVARVENTFVMTFDFWSQSPDKAAQIANAFAETFIQNQLDANTDTSKQAADWLKGRLLEQSAQVVKADSAVIDFKRQNGIAMADGKSIEDQALADLSAKLTEATANKNDAKARLDQIEAAMRSEVASISVNDAMRNEVITKLRQQYLDNAQRATYFTSKYGKEHGVVVRLTADNANIATSIRNELRRIEEGYRSEYEVARGREEQLRASLDTQFRKTVDLGQVQIKLAELDATARAARQSYDTAMQRYLQAVQRQSFPVSDARVLSAAAAPLKKDKPKRTLLLAIGLAGGALLGFGASIGAELIDRRFRTKRDVEQLTGIQCMGFVPMMVDKAFEKRAVKTADQPRAARARMPCDYVVRAPFSVATEVIRGIKIAADQANDGEGARVIGVISALPGEGKSSIAANLAHLIAHSGSLVLLVDGDLRSPSLSRLYTPDADVGLPDILAGQAERRSATYNITPLPLYFIPARTRMNLQQSDGIIASSAMQRFIDECRTQYTYIVIDLPPFVPVVDVKAAAHLIDGFALVIEWGVTPREVIGDALAAMPGIWNKIFGSVLNKASIKELKRYGEYVGHYDNKNYFKH
jgi:succinoglycan biosynthesis transport protein ExoP